MLHRRGRHEKLGQPDTCRREPDRLSFATSRADLAAIDVGRLQSEGRAEGEHECRSRTPKL